MAIKRVSQMSSWGIVLTDQARSELIDTVLPQFRAGNWAAASTPIGSPAEGTVGKQPATNTARTGGSKLNPQKTGAAGKDGENLKELTGKRKAHDPDSVHKSKKHKKDGDVGSKRKDKEKHRVKDVSKEDQRAGSKGASGREGGSGGKGPRKEETKEEKKVRKESKRDEKEKKSSKRDREKERSGEKKRDKVSEHNDKRDQVGEKKKRKVDGESKASKGVQHATEDERGDKAKRSGKSPLADGDKGTMDGWAAKSRHPSPAAAQNVNNSDAPRRNKAPDSARSQPPSAPVVAQQISSRSPSPAPHMAVQNASQRQSTEEPTAKTDVQAKLSSPIPPKVVPPKVAMELLEGDGKSMPAWLETADDGAADAVVDGNNAADKSDEGAAEPEDRTKKDKEAATPAAAVGDVGNSSPSPMPKQQEEEKKKNKKDAPAEADDDDDDDDFSVGHAAAPPRRPPSTGLPAGSISVQQGGRVGGDVASEFTPVSVADPEKEEFKDTWVGRTGTPDGVPSEEGEYIEDDEIDHSGVYTLFIMFFSYQ